MTKREKLPRETGANDERGSFGDLRDAALALERDLARFEELTATARRLPLDTRKSVERAAKATTESAAEQERVDAALGALVAAITAAGRRHEANVAALQVRGEEIRARAEVLSDYYAQYTALGEEGRLVNELVQEAAERQRGATTPEQLCALVESLVTIDARMAKLVDVARALHHDASVATITDIAEQADALRQQVASARNKLGLLRAGLAARIPDGSTLN